MLEDWIWEAGKLGSLVRVPGSEISNLRHLYKGLLSTFFKTLYALVKGRSSCMLVKIYSLDPLMLVILRIPRMSMAASETRRCAPVDNGADRRNK